MRGERLSLRSSDFWLPWGFVSQDCVEDGEQLSSDGDDRGELVFAGGNELVAEQLEGRVVACRDHGPHEQSAAHARSAAADEAFAPPFAGLPGPRSKSGEGRDLAAVERTQFWQFGNQGARDGWPNARHRGEQVFLLGPGRRSPHVVGDVVVQFGQFLLQRLAQPGDALLQAGKSDMTCALAFCRDHLDDLAPAGDKIGEQLCCRVGQLPKPRFGGFSKVRDHGGIDRIGLGTFAERLREGPYLSGIDHHHRQAGAGQASCDHRLETAGGLNRHQLDREWLQPFDQIVDPGARAADGKTLTARAYRHVQPVFRYIDANINRVHLIPSLRNRASRAAQATVRVRWNGRRRPSLSHGLGVPQVARSLACHRTANLSRSGNVQVTRVTWSTWPVPRSHDVPPSRNSFACTPSGAWVAAMIRPPRARCSCIKPATRLCPAASSALVGSSSSQTGRRTVSSRATESRRRCPADKYAAGRCVA